MRQVVRPALGITSVVAQWRDFVHKAGGVLRMNHFRLLALFLTAMAGACLSSCETGNVARRLPAYEPPIAKSSFQLVRTTAYTHTESDHLEYTNHNALGGELHAAGPPVRRADTSSTQLSLGLATFNDYRVASTSAAPQPFSMADEDDVPKARPQKKAAPRLRPQARDSQRAIPLPVRQPPRVGSAAADWSRWPVGTTFRLLSSGQIYRVDDYGWALAGRNTIDLYMATPLDMNSWGVRQEQIQVIAWGDPQESLRLLQSHQNYKHIRRMVMELQGREQDAATLQ